MKRLVAFTLERKVTIFMLALAATLVGCIAYLSLPLELMPRGFTSSNISIWIPVPSSNPKEVQEQVVRPTEEEIRTVPGIKSTTSEARADSARIHVQLNPDADVNLAVAELRDRMERARAQWPEQVRDYHIRRFNMDTDLPIFSFAISLDRYTADVTFLVEEKIINPLEALPGVAKVDCWGLLDDQIRINVDRKKALSENVGIYQLTQSLRKANLERAGGEIGEGATRYSLRTDARIRDVADLKAVPINKRGLRLGDVARIEPTKAVRQFMVLSGNRPVLWCQILKESSANTVQTGRMVRQFIKRNIIPDARLKELGARIQFFESTDFGQTIERSLDNLRRTAVLGALLALLTLFFFLRRLRLTLIITLSIPLSLLITLGIIYFSGGTLNVLCMLGMTISVGMLIDNSIVVAENIGRHRDLGQAPAQAAFKGTSEVALAILLSTLTTLAAFIPVIFMTGMGNVSFFTKGLGIPLCLAMGASLLVALLFIPLATAVFSHGRHGPAKRGWRRSRIIETSRSLYGRSLGWCLENRFLALLLILPSVLGLTALAWQKLPKVDVMSDNGGRLRVGVDLDKNFTLKDASLIFHHLGAWMEAHQKPYHVKHYWCFFSRRGGSFSINLDDSDMDLTRRMAKKLRAVMPEEAGVKLRFGIEDQKREEDRFHLDVFGQRPEKLLALSKELEQRLEKVPGVLSVSLDMEEGREELHIIPDRGRMLHYHVLPAWLRGTIAYGIRGFRISDLIREGREIPLIIQFDRADKRTLAEVRDMPIPTLNGSLVPLRNVANLKMERGIGIIRRTNGRLRSRLTLETGMQDTQELRSRVLAALKGFPLPPGYSFKDNKGEEVTKTYAKMMGTVALAVTFVFLLMGILFESFLLPLSVLVAIPFSFCGAVWILAATHTPLDFLGGIGVVVLVGIVVNNGIVLIDCARLSMPRSRNRLEALVSAGRTRFRPILMTAATTIVGLLPMALTKDTGSQISYKALSRSIIGGLLVSTFFTLYFVPLLYTVLDDFRHQTRTLVRSLPAALLDRQAAGQPRPRSQIGKA